MNCSRSMDSLSQAWPARLSFESRLDFQRTPLASTWHDCQGPAELPRPRGRRQQFLGRGVSCRVSANSVLVAARARNPSLGFCYAIRPHPDRLMIAASALVTHMHVIRSGAPCFHHMHEQLASRAWLIAKEVKSLSGHFLWLWSCSALSV